MQTLEQLQSHFSGRDVAFKSGHGDLLKVVVRNQACAAEVYLYGAHVTAFAPHGQQPVLWMSQQSWFEAAKPIRGGIPICFPWFGPHPSDASQPAHGFARISTWQLASVRSINDASTELMLRLEFGGLELQYRLVFANELTADLIVRNAMGQSATQRCEQALHSYFCVSDVRNVSIEGLEQSEYLDKVDSGSRRPASGEVIHIEAECDRVYLATPETCRILDPGLGRVIRVAKRNSTNTVVWNPWIAKSERMSDFGNDEWQRMLCVETANVGDAAIALEPEGTHTLGMTISLE